MLFPVILVYSLRLSIVCVVDYSILQQMLSDPCTLNEHMRGWYGFFFVWKFHFWFFFILKEVSTHCYKGEETFCKGILGTE